MHIESLISDLAFILLLGAVVTVLFKWIKQPVVLGYIVAGFLASPHFEYLPSVTTEENIDFWAQIGIVVLLFSLGLEFSFKKLMNSGGSAAVTAFIIISGMMCTGIGIGHAMGLTTINCLFLGGMLSMSSTTIIIKAFDDLGLRQRKFTSLVLAVLIVEDLFAVVMMVLLSSIAINKTVEGGALVFSIAKLVFFLVIWFVVGVFVLPTALNACRRYLNGETLLVVSMGLCLGMAVFSVYCGFSLALGAFVMGSVLAGTSYAERIEHVVTPVKDLFGSVFFISVGMMVQPAVIAEYGGSILFLSIAVITGMIIFGTFGMLVTGQTLRVAIESGFSLTQIGEFAFIIATLGMSLGVLDPSIYPIVVAVSVLTTFLTPYFIKMSPHAADFLERHLPARMRVILERYQRQAARSNARQHGWFFALRCYISSTLLYSMILVAVIIAGDKFLMPWLDGLAPSWGRLISTVATLAAMSPFLMALLTPISAGPDDDTSRSVPAVPRIVLSIFRFVVALGFVIYVMAKFFSPGVGATVGACIAVGIILLFSRKVKARMSRIEDKFLYNLNERDLRRSGKNNNIVGDLHMAYITVGDGCCFAGMPLAESELRTRYGVSVAGINRGGTVMPVPSPKTRIYPGDVLCVIGSDEQISTLLPVVEAKLPEPENESDYTEFRLDHILLTAGSNLVGMTPVTARLSARGVLLVSVQRGDEYIDASPDVTFADGDIIHVAGSPAHLKELNL